MAAVKESTGEAESPNIAPYVEILSRRAQHIEEHGYGAPVALGEGSSVQEAISAPTPTGDLPARVPPRIVLEGEDGATMALSMGGHASPADPAASAKADGGVTTSHPAPADVAACVRSALTTQQQRVAAYRELDAALSCFTSDPTPQRHGQLLAELQRLTRECAAISNAMRRIGTEAGKLEAGGEVAELVAQLQQNEGVKWRLTLNALSLRVQLAILARAPGAVSADCEAAEVEADLRQRLAEARSSLAGVVEEVADVMGYLSLAGVEGSDETRPSVPAAPAPGRAGPGEAPTEASASLE